MSPAVVCKFCGGTGIIKKPDPDKPRTTGATVKVPCPVCSGTGILRI